MDERYNIIVVDDDAGIRELLKDYLEQHDFEVTTVADGKELEQTITEQTDLIVLDIMLPGDDGFTICNKLRVYSEIPIIMLTARGNEMDRINGLESGADDYLAKPFHPRELLARINAILKRSSTNQHSIVKKDKLVHFSNWVLNCNNRHLVSSTNIVSPLSEDEFNLLLLFINSPRCILSRDDIQEQLYARERSPLDRTIDMKVSRLRKRLQTYNDSQIIQTIRGKGYLFNSDPVFK